MKKNYFLAAILSFAMVSMNAQFVDDMESYTDGSPISGAHWTDWGCGGGAGCAIMSSSAQAQGGSLSGLIPDDGSTDAVLDLGGKIFGAWGLEFYMYVPANQEGYFNLQGVVPIGSGEWIVGNFFFNQDNANPGVGHIDDTANGDVSFNFPHDEWFRIVMNFDISAGIGASTWSMSVANDIVVPDGTAFTKADGTYPTSLGGFDFFSIAATNTYYLDTFDYMNDFFPLTLGTNDFAAKGFDAYKDRSNILHLSANETINNVAIYNMLGQEVYRAGTVSTIDMASYANGTYIVKVNVGGTEGSIKIIR